MIKLGTSAIRDRSIACVRISLILTQGVGRAYEFTNSFIMVVFGKNYFSRALDRQFLATPTPKSHGR